MLDLVKNALRLDESEAESDLVLLIEAGKEFLTLSGVPEPPYGNESALYKRGIIIYSMLNHENHDKSLNVNSLTASLQSIILQLKSFGGDT